MNLQEMIARQRELTEQARSAGRTSLTADEQREFDELQRQIEALQNSNPTPTPASTPASGERAATPATSAPEPTPAAPNAENERRAGAEAERTRIREITALCRDFGIDEARFVNSDMTIDQVRASVLEQLRANSGPVNARVTGTGEDARRAAISDALLMRAGIHIENPAAGASDFAGASLRSIAASCLAAENGGSGSDYFMMDASRLFDVLMQRQYLTPVAAFPSILDQTIEKAYVEGHRTAPVTFDRFCSIGSLSDFKKATNRYVAGSFGDFLEVPEGGELKHFVPQDEKLPQRELKTYGRQFTMSRQAFIDDDIGMITRLPRQAAQAARRTQNKQVYDILVNNQVIYDGTNLFTSGHKNLLAKGTDITQEAVQSMILALGGHVNDAGDAILIRPAYLIVPLGYKFKMYTLFNSATISASGDVNPLYQYRDQIEIVEDATINALVKSGSPIPWFMMGAKDDAETIQVDYLNGKAIPNVRRMEVAGQLGYVWDFYLDWGISVQDFRGVVKNPGVAITSPVALA